MTYRPVAQEVHDLIEDYLRDFGVALPYKDAERMLVLYDELCVLFEKYSDGTPLPPHLVLG